MTNETIEKIKNAIPVQIREYPNDNRKVILSGMLRTHIAEAVYQQIVEPLEGKIEGYKNWINCKGNDLNYFMNESEELQHKVKVLERALRYLAHDFNGQQFYIYAQSDTDEETYEKFIRRAEKEL